MKKFTKYSRGFTLIELLVVIAIIGILSAIVLASLSTARGKGKDAAAEEQMSGARAQMEIYAGSNLNSYTGGCASTTMGAANILAGVKSSEAIATSSNDPAVAPFGAYNQLTCNDSGTAWAAQAPLSASVSGSPVYWCVDSSGTSRQEVTTFSAAGTVVCPTL
jgi:prepilin-type N-terminal cleavage/methylation domain-containing protein